MEVGRRRRRQWRTRKREKGRTREGWDGKRGWGCDWAIHLFLFVSSLGLFGITHTWPGENEQPAQYLAQLVLPTWLARGYALDAHVNASR